MARERAEEPDLKRTKTFSKMPTPLPKAFACRIKQNHAAYKNTLGKGGTETTASKAAHRRESPNSAAPNEQPLHNRSNPHSTPGTRPGPHD